MTVVNMVNWCHSNGLLLPSDMNEQKAENLITKTIAHWLCWEDVHSNEMSTTSKPLCEILKNFICVFYHHYSDTVAVQNNGQCFTASLNILTVLDILAHSSYLLGITLPLFQCFNVQIDFLPSGEAEHFTSFRKGSNLSSRELKVGWWEW